MRKQESIIVRSVSHAGIVCSQTVLLIIVMVLLAGCDDPTEFSQSDISPAPDMAENSQHWYEFVDELNTDAIIIVQNDGSIQEAIDVAKPGEVICVEPGFYSEALPIDKSITLLGLDTENGGPVMLENPGINSITLSEEINIQNIQLRNYQIAESKSSKNYALRSDNNRHPIHIERDELGGGVALYTIRVRTGRGKYDMITLYRLIKEGRPYHPAPSQGNVFMVHGASQNFEDIYLEPGADPTPQTSVVMYLAANGIDVWGISLGWTHVPKQETDFSFMENWGVEREVQDILKGVSIARLIRGLTKQAFGRMNLLGFSYSVGLAYAAAGHETQEHWIKRDLSGIIAVDGGLTFDPGDAFAIGLSCSNAQAIKTNIDNGIFHSEFGAGIFGVLAYSAPDVASPIIPGLNNYQAALFLGANSYDLFPVPNDFWHFVAGEYDSGLPAGLAYSSPERWIRLLAFPHAGPYMPLLSQYQLRSCECDPQTSPLDDHLTEVGIPALYIGSGGGVSSQGFYSIDQLGSTDKTKYVVSLNPEPTVDFGHADLFIADNADSEMWEMLRQWLIGAAI